MKPLIFKLIMLINFYNDFTLQKHPIPTLFKAYLQRPDKCSEDTVILEN